jgi:hypothetical protein
MTDETDWWLGEAKAAEQHWRQIPRWRVFRRARAYDAWMSAVRVMGEKEMLRAASARRAARRRAEYPHSDGDVLVLGPEIFVSSDGRVISWQGTNYVLQDESPAVGEPGEVVFAGHMVACSRCGHLILAGVADDTPRCADEVSCTARARPKRCLSPKSPRSPYRRTRVRR